MSNCPSWRGTPPKIWWWVKIKITTKALFGNSLSGMFKYMCICNFEISWKENPPSRVISSVNNYSDIFYLNAPIDHEVRDVRIFGSGSEPMTHEKWYLFRKISKMQICGNLWKRNADIILHFHLCFEPPFYFGWSQKTRYKTLLCSVYLHEQKSSLFPHALMLMTLSRCSGRRSCGSMINPSILSKRCTMIFPVWWPVMRILSTTVKQTGGRLTWMVCIICSSGNFKI